MRDLWDWLDGKMRVRVILTMLFIVCAAGALGYMAPRTLHPLQALVQTAATTATPTPTTQPGFIVLWEGSSEARTGPKSPVLSLTDSQATHGISLLWRCLPAPDGLPTSFSISIQQDSNRFAWVGNAVQCGASGNNYINSLHGGTFQIDITATGPWTLRMLAHKP